MGGPVRAGWENTVTSTPLVDVIIPTRNRAGLTMEAIESVRAQTFRDWRVIVADDCSDEGSWKELASAAEIDERITVVRRETQGGAQEARQTGLQHASATFIAILDSDDLWETTKLERQVEYYNRHRESLGRLGAVLCGHVWVDAEGTVRKTRQPHVCGPASPLVSDNMSTLLVRREALDEAGGFLPPGEISRAGANHIDFYVRLTKVCDFVAVPEVLVTCRAHAGGRDSDVLATRVGADNLAYLLERHRAYLDGFPSEKAQLHARTGARYFTIGERREGATHFAAAFRDTDWRTAIYILRRYARFLIRTLLSGPKRSASL